MRSALSNFIAGRSRRSLCPNVGFRRRLHLGLDRPGKF